jgi:hypothetical protein
MKIEDAMQWCRGERDFRTKESTQHQVMNICLSALEKQIPKAPIGDPESWLCPNCKSGVWHEQQKMYCRQCGQLIAWNKI